METVKDTGHEALLKTIRALSPKQRAVFDQLCVGNDSGHHQRTVESLMRRRLVYEYEEKTVSGSIHCVVYRYTVPTAVHMAWAEVCSEENPE